MSTVDRISTTGGRSSQPPWSDLDPNGCTVNPELCQQELLAAVLSHKTSVVEKCAIMEFVLTILI